MTKEAQKAKPHKCPGTAFLGAQMVPYNDQRHKSAISGRPAHNQAASLTQSFLLGDPSSPGPSPGTHKTVLVSINFMSEITR